MGATIVYHRIQRGKDMGNRMIRSDAQTIEKLKVIAGDRSLSELLRDIAEDRESPLETLRASLLKQLEDIKAQISGLDESWFKSFVKHEKDVMFLSNVQALMLKVQDKVNTGAWDYVMKEAERITNENWREYLEKNELTEIEGIDNAPGT